MNLLHWARIAAAAILTAMAVPALSLAQDQFGSIPTGAQEVPPNVSAARGRAYFSLDPATNRLFYRVEHNVAGAHAASIHQAAVGVNGPVIFPLTIVNSTEIRGATPPLTAAQKLTLFQGGYYINIQSPAFPAGEIRAQITKTFVRHFTAILNGAHEVPPSGSPGTGIGEVTLHVPENVLTIRLQATGLTGPPQAAHIHQAAAGVNGPVIMDLAPLQIPATARWCGVTAPLTAAQVTALLGGGLYFNIHTPAFPGGEIRGQLIPTKENFVAQIGGAQEVPPSGSASTGFGSFTFDPASSTVTYNVNWNGLGGTMAQVHTGFPGQNGAILFGLAGPPNGPWAGVSAALSEASITALFTQGLYVNIQSGAFPGGEARGQLLQNGARYGFAGNTSAGNLRRILRIEDWGIPTLSNPYNVRLFDTLPGAFSSLAYSENLFATPLELTFVPMPGHYLFGNPLAGYTAPVADPSGFTELNLVIPPLTALISQDFYFQWFSFDPGANSVGLGTSDALRTIIQ